MTICIAAKYNKLISIVKYELYSNKKVLIYEKQKVNYVRFFSVCKAR